MHQRTILFGAPLPPYTYIEMDNRYIDGIGDDSILTLSSHEYFHAIQDRYLETGGGFAKAWVTEGTSDWMKQEVAKFYGYSYMYMDDAYNYLRQPERDIKTYKIKQSTGEGYAAALYWYFLANDVDQDIVRQFWINLGSILILPWEKVISAIDTTLSSNADYSSFDESYVVFTKANYFKSRYPSIPKIDKDWGLPKANTTDLNLQSEATINNELENYGSLYYELLSSTDAKIKITFNGDSQTNFFVKVFPAGEESREDQINLGSENSIEVPRGLSDGTLVIVGRLGGGGNGEFSIIFTEISGATERKKDLLAQSSTAVRSLPIDPTASQAIFTTTWNGSDLDVVLISPNGTVITPAAAQNDSNINYTTESKKAYYLISAPEPGIWTMNVTGADVPPEGENFTTYASLDSNLSLYAFTGEERYDPNQAVEIVASLKNNNSPITNANVTAQIIKPDESTENITLSDNGNGNYSALFNDTSMEGSYYLTINALGTINGYLFSRETKTLTEVRLIPDLTLSAIDISFSNNTPRAGQNVTINATIHNSGDAITNATVWFYDNDTFIGETTTGDVAPNGSDTISILWDIPKSGEHNVYVDIDPYNSILEKNETNNIANLTINVSLAMELELSCLTDNVTYIPNGNVTIACYVQNFDGDPISVDLLKAEFNTTTGNIALNLTENLTGYYLGTSNQINGAGVYVVNISATKEGYNGDAGCNYVV